MFNTIDPNKKKCEKCSGLGRINFRKYTYCHPGDPIEEVETSDKCETCNGKGYLEKVEVWR